MEKTSLRALSVSRGSELTKSNASERLRAGDGANPVGVRNSGRSEQMLDAIRAYVARVSVSIETGQIIIRISLVERAPALP
jgi:hypothetical protein